MILLLGIMGWGRKEIDDIMTCGLSYVFVYLFGENNPHAWNHRMVDFVLYNV